jgi:hypothetical protein
MDRSQSDTYARIRSAILDALKRADGPVPGESLDLVASAAAGVTPGRARNARYRLVNERAITNLDRIDGCFYVLGSQPTGEGQGPKTGLERRLVAVLRDRPLSDAEAGQAVRPKLPQRLAREVLEGLVRRGALVRQARPHDVRYAIPQREEQFV